VQHALALGLVPAMLQRLLRLGTFRLSPAAAGGGLHGLPGLPLGDLPPPEATSAAAVAPAATAPAHDAVSNERFFQVLTAVVHALPVAALLDDRDSNVLRAADEAVLGCLQQLLSCPEALAVMVSQGLSAEALEAAAGGDLHASECVAAVQFVARWLARSLLQLRSVPHDNTRATELCGLLEAFLGHEERLPLLEALCEPRAYQATFGTRKSVLWRSRACRHLSSVHMCLPRAPGGRCASCRLHRPVCA
jgi:hypothetical protein